jgi:hypothetical protein
VFSAQSAHRPQPGLEPAGVGLDSVAYFSSKCRAPGASSSITRGQTGHGRW